MRDLNGIIDELMQRIKLDFIANQKTQNKNLKEEKLEEHELQQPN